MNSAQRRTRRRKHVAKLMIGALRGDHTQTLCPHCLVPVKWVQAYPYDPLKHGRRAYCGQCSWQESA